jgi:hypothetical protein
MQRIVRLTGRHPGLAKTALTEVLREECGMRLADAKRSVDDLMHGRVLRFDFADEESAERFAARARQCRAAVDSGKEDDPLLEAVRGYIFAGDGPQRRRLTRELRHDAQRVLAGSLAFSAGTLLAGEPDWPRGAWVEDVLDAVVSMPHPHTVALRGTMSWADGARGQWIEPFAATVTISDTAASIVSLTLQVCDADTGLKQVPYGGDSPARWSDIDQWIFTFQYEG